MPDETSFDSHGDRVDATHWTAGSPDLTRNGRRPCIVMAHGLGGTRDSGLEPFAERFAAAGADVLCFDYRGFGTSGGAPRQDVDHRRHREDYRAAVAHARGLPGVDPDRVVVWGSSYSGGHVVHVAAEDPRIAGVISQGAAMGGAAAVLQILSYAGPGQLARLTGHALRDAAAGMLRRPGHGVAVYGPAGSTAAITSPDAEAGYGSIVGPSFRNEILARGILRIPLNRPVRAAGRLTQPVLFVVATRDQVAPVPAVRRAVERAGPRARVLELDVGHFEIYRGEPFERSVAEQVAFLRSL